MANEEVRGADVARRIRAIDQEFMDSVAAKDVARVAALYADDARILMPGRPLISGSAEIRDFWTAALAGLVEAITLETTDIQASGDLAYCVGQNTIVLRPAGEPSREERGKYAVVYRREPAGEWKIVVDSYSHD